MTRVFALAVHAAFAQDDDGRARVMAEILFLTELIGLRVLDLRGRQIGRVRDAAIVPRIDAGRVDRFLIGGGWAWLTVRHDQVATVGLDGLKLRDEQLTPYHDDEYMLRIVRDLLDQQIIDAKGRKVVRVSDLTFDVRRVDDHDELHVVDVDVGLRSVLRRVVQGVAPPRLVRWVQRPIAPRSIPWAVCNIVEPDPQRRLRLNISYDYLEKMHPADIADIVEDLGPDEREAIFETIDEEVAAEALSEVEPEMQASILEGLEPEKAAEIVQEMSPDEAADVLQELQEETAGEILEEMEPEVEHEVRELLSFKENTAGGLMNTEYVALPASATAGDALTALRGQPELAEATTTLLLEDQAGIFAGSVPVTRVLLADPSAALVTLVAEPFARVHVNEREDRVVEAFDKYNLLALAVVDDDERIAGMITADDVISLLASR